MLKALRLLFLVCTVSVPVFAEDVRVLTFNIRYDNPKDGPDQWSNRREAVAKLIAEQADVAGLQEVKPGQRAWLGEKLTEFGVIGIGREPEDKDEAAPILYRKERFEAVASGTFWLSNKPEEPGSKSFGNTLPRICTWAKLREAKTNKTLWFYNVHLDHQSAPGRELGLALVLDRMAAREGTEPALLVGDFNSGDKDAPLRALAAREKPALVSTYQALQVPADGTFHGFTGKTQGGAIDFILMEKGRWTVKSGAILKTTYPGVDEKPRYVSDHFPVQAVLSLVR